MKQLQTFIHLSVFETNAPMPKQFLRECEAAGEKIPPNSKNTTNIEHTLILRLLTE